MYIAAKNHRIVRNSLKAGFNYLLICILAACLFSTEALAQNTYYGGFQKAVHGTDFTYHSPYSHNDPCLLSRATKDFDAIEWETTSVPADFKEKSISFIWLYGIDVLPDKQNFAFYVNDVHVLTFSNPMHNDPNASWEISDGKGIHLRFHRTMIDKHGDQMGYAVLTVPTSHTTPGKPLHLKVDGEDNFSAAWYMTYKLPLENKFSAKQLNTVTKEKGQLFHTIRFNIVHLAAAQHALLSVDGQQKSIELQTGLNEIDFPVPQVEKPTEVVTSVKIGRQIQEELVSLAPVKEWTVYLVQHTHTDIGYTRPQSEILAEHLRYIDNALDYCDQTDHLPKDAQFRWTCEASWTVREYLNSRPQAQIDRLLKRISEGRIEVTGMFFNFCDVVDETALAIQTQTLNLFKSHGIDVTTAMQNDVNGIGWCMVDLYENTGVKYLTMGQHGHRAHVPFDKPTSFWWESPSGNRLLAYRSEHYMHGNTLSLTSGDMDVFRDNLSKYLLDLEKKAYPFDRVSLQFSGYITDNSPPSTKACEIVKAWNEKYEWPKLKLSLASEFMVFLDEQHSNDLETKQVAWPDWWSDGFGSAMNETKAARNTHSNMIATMSLLALAEVLGTKMPEGIHREILACYDNLLFYDEHTFGADESISNPSSENSINQWRQKAAYVWSANQQANLLREKALGLLQAHIEKSEKPTVTVFNTLNWPRSGLVEVFIDHDLLPLDKEFSIKDAKGNSVPSQLIKSRNDGSLWALWVKDIPPLGYTNLTIDVTATPTKPTTARMQLSNILENAHYKIVVDEQNMGVQSIYDKETGKELIDPASPYSLGAFIYELLENRSDLERLTYLNRDTVYHPIQRELHYLRDFHITKTEEHPLWKSLHLHGKIPECASEEGVNVEIRLYTCEKKIELLYGMTKTANTNPEAVYIAFPFQQDTKDNLLFDVQGGVVQPGINQLEGTASDWNTIQNFAAVKGATSQIVFCSSDAPLVQFGDINTGHFYYRHQPEQAHIYSWVLNNYWTTNFRASQHGELKWKYQLTSSNDRSLSFATRFGYENRVPLVGRVNPASAKASTPSGGSILNLQSPANLLLVEARPGLRQGTILLHLRETEGDHALLDIAAILQNPRIESIVEVNALEEEQKVLSGPLLIEHFETKFLLLKLRE